MRDRLDAFLADTAELPLVEQEREARNVMAGATRASVEAWRRNWYDQIENFYRDLVQRQRSPLQEAHGDLLVAALDLLSMCLRGDVSVLTESDLPAFCFDFEPEMGRNHALVSGARTRVPSRIGRRRVEGFLRDEAVRMVDKHLGRARASLQSRLEDAGRLLRAQVADAFAGPTDGLRTGQHAALAICAQNETGQKSERRRLAEKRRALAEMADSLRELGAQPDQSLSSAHASQRSTGVRPLETEEESP